MKAAMEAAAKEAEERMAAEMEEAVRKAEAAIEESAVREREKMSRDMARGNYEARAAEDRVNKTRASRASFSDVVEDVLGSVASGSLPAPAYAEADEAPDMDDADPTAPSMSKAASSRVVKEEFFDVTIVRDLPGGTLGIAVDLWDGEVTVGAITTDGPADREGTLIQGDIIRAVEGVVCNTIEEVTEMVIKGSKSLMLSICRRPVTTVLESHVLMKMPSGEWEPFAFRLLSNRNIEYEKLSPPLFSGEIHARLAHSLSLGADGIDKVLEIETGHKTFQIKSHTPAELAKWHLRLQEVIMLQEKVANVAHGWLLKEESASESGGGTQLRHYWFVLFSNGILMYFTDPNRAVLGQSCGFIPVEQCAESSQSSKQHTLLVKCSFDSWLLATNSKENMLQWAASLHSAKPSQQTTRQAVDLVLAQGWLDLPKEDEYGAEIWERHWFVLKNSVLNMFSEEQKKADKLSAPLLAMAVADMVSATRGKGVEFYKWGIGIETVEGVTIRMRAVGQSEMRQLLSTLNVHCIVAPAAKPEPLAPKTKAVIKSGWLFKKSEKKAGVHVGKAWQRRWFVLEVETEEQENGSLIRTGKLAYYHTSKDAKDTPDEGVTIPLHETMSVKPGMGKTKGTEYRITLQTAKREWELGSGEDAVAKDWVEQLQQWVGLPKVERARGESIATGARVVKAQWMECRVNVYKPDEISDEELARSNTIQKTVSSFSRTFTLSRNKPKKEEAPAVEKPPEEEEEEDDDDDGVFNWVYVALMSDHTLRQYEDEGMGVELGQLKLGYLVQTEFLDDLPDATYEHAFVVKPDSPTAGTWVLCPDTRKDSEEWMKVLKA